MSKSQFTLLRGGLNDKLMKSMEFVSGYITDTRLMGVMCMHLHWINKDNIYEKLMTEMGKKYPGLSADRFSTEDFKEAKARFATEPPICGIGKTNSAGDVHTPGEISFGDDHYRLKKIGDHTVKSVPDDNDFGIDDDEPGSEHDELDFGHDEFSFGYDEVGPDFHQFFYLDSESYGLENYKSVRGNDYAAISVIEQTLAGGLGGKQVEINEMEAAAILQEYAGISRDHGLQLPDNHEEFDFLLKKKIELTPAQLRSLAKKQCCRILSDPHAANYFMMRIFGHDYKAAEFLMGAPFKIDIYDNYTDSTLLQNTVEPYSQIAREDDVKAMAFEALREGPHSDDGPLPEDEWAGTYGQETLLRLDFSEAENYFLHTPGRSKEDRPSERGEEKDKVPNDAVSDENEAKDKFYRCTSLIESMGNYYIIVTELKMRKRHVIGMRNISRMKISDVESALILAHSEFVTVYEMIPEPDEFAVMMMQSAVNAVITGYESGTMFMIFNSHNDHVNKKVFKLRNDVYGIYFVSNSGQLLVSSSSRANITKMEQDLRKSLLSRKLIMTAKYEFHEPILLDFINSDFESFEEFLDFIKV